MGHKTCVTTSINAQCECAFPYCNDNVFSYFDNRGSAFIHDTITLQTPFVHIPSNPSVNAEAFGFVPQRLIDSMAQAPGYLAKYPQLVSILPGGPRIGRVKGAGAFIEKELTSANVLTSATTVTISSNACYNKGQCSISPTPVAKSQAPTPTITAAPTPPMVQGSHPHYGGNGLDIPVNTGTGNQPAEMPAPDSNNQAPGDPMQAPEPSSPKQDLQPQGATDMNQAQTVVLPEKSGLASIIVNAMGGAPIAAPAPPLKTQPTPSYVVSLDPSASAVVVNGVTSPVSNPTNVGANPIVTINSQPTTLGTVPVLAINGQNVVAGASTATIQGVLVSLAPLATAIVVNRRTTPLSPGQTPIITLGSEPVTASPMSRYVLGGRTLVPGAAAITVSGTPISMPTEGNAVIIGESTVAIPNTPGAVLPEITLGNRVITANSASQFLLGDQTLAPGAPAITVAAPAGAIAAFGPSPKALTVGGKVFTPNPLAFAIDGTTISAGGPGMTVDGTPIRLGPSGILDIGGSTMSLPVSEVSPTAYTIGAQVFTPNPTAFSIYGTTISAGGSGATVDGTVVSLGPSGLLEIGSSTISLGVEAASPTPTAYTAGNQIFTPNPTAFLIDGTTISVGGPGATVDGTVVSLGPSGLLEIGSSTISLGVEAASPTPTAYTAGNQIFTPNPTAFQIDGTTISAGGPGVTIDGTFVNLGSSGALNIGSSTISLAPSPAYTVGGKIFTPNPTAFSIDGTIISAGGSGVNIDGTLVSLESSGVLDIGSSRILLPPGNVYTVGGETFAPNPTAFSIDGTKISAGGLGVTIDGTIVSLGASGILDIGSSRILLPTSNVYTVGGETFTPNPTAFQIDGTTISAAGPGVTIDGMVVSLGASGILYIGSSTISLLSGNTDYAGNPISLATSAGLDIADSTIPLTNGDSALMTPAAGPGPGATSSSTLPRSTHSGGEAQTSRPRIGRLGITLIIGCVVMLR